MSERELPHNLDAERSVIAACLVDGAAVDVAMNLLQGGEFYRDAHHELFQSILRLANAGTGIDFVTLKNDLGRHNALESVGLSYLSTIADGVPRGVNVEYYAGIVKEKWRLRKTIAAAGQMLTDAYDSPDTASVVIERAEQTLFELRAGDSDKGPRATNSLTASLFARLERRATERRAVTGVESGFYAVDAMTAGYQPGDLVIVAARPSMGKSAYALQAAIHAARSTNVPVVLFSLEMGEESLSDRAAAYLARVDSHEFRRGRLSPEDYQRVGDAICVYGSMPLYIDDTAGLSPMQIRSRARRIKAQHGLSLLIVDYLQLMGAVSDGKKTRRADNRTEELSQISRAMKGIAKDLNVPVIALSQLSRAVEQRADKRPLLSDLRESGAIEQDADVVQFIYRDHYYNAQSNPFEAELILAKQRNGPTGTVELRWIAEHASFANAAN